MYEAIICQRAPARGPKATGLEPLELAALGGNTPASVTLFQPRSSLAFLVVRPCVAAARLMQLHDGRLTKANLLNRDWVRLLLGVLAVEHPGFKVSWFNPGSMSMAR